jgi:hypothetical protein
MRVITPEDRDLNAIKSSSLDRFEPGVVLLGNVSSPKKQIHADLHNLCQGVNFRRKQGHTKAAKVTKVFRDAGKLGGVALSDLSLICPIHISFETFATFV